MLRSNVFISSVFITAFSIFSCAGHSIPDSDLVIKHLIEDTAKPHRLSGPADRFKSPTGQEELLKRTRSALELFVFKGLASQFGLSEAEKDGLVKFVFGLANRSIPFPIRGDGTYATEEVPAPNSLLNIKLAHIRYALVDVLTEISLRKNLGSLIERGSGRVTIADSHLPTLGMWLYLQLIALHVAHTGYDFENPGDNETEAPVSFGQIVGLAYQDPKIKRVVHYSAMAASFGIITAIFMNTLNINPIRSLIGGAAGASIVSLLLSFLDRIDPYKDPNVSPEIDLNYAGTPPEHFKPGQKESYFLDNILQSIALIDRGGGFARGFRADPTRDLAENLTLERLELKSLGGSHQGVAVRNFLIDAQIDNEGVSASGSNSITSPISRLLNRVIVFESGPCVQNINSGSSVFVETRDIF